MNMKDSSIKEYGEMKSLFVKLYGEDAISNDYRSILVRAPGRVNLIGEHTDYNDGFVFPMAIDFKILIMARRRTDGIVKIFSADYHKSVEFPVNQQPIPYDNEQRWSNYPRGVFQVLMENGMTLGGVEMVVRGDIPQGSGLSSSAAFEVATAMALKTLFNLPIEKRELAVLCQKAENTFVGMNCGIMDQFISMMGEKNHALFLDCRNLDYQNISLDLGDYRIVICQSGVKHSLVDSEYNKRRKECEEGVRALAGRYPRVKALRDATLEHLESCYNDLDPVVFRRCRHVISEDKRVLESIQALKSSDLKKFGQLMNESHESLRLDYEVSCPELDFLVAFAREVPGVLGARMTGGGFGGCTVNLVHSSAIDAFSSHVLKKYEERTGIKAHLYVSTPANGSEVMKSQE